MRGSWDLRLLLGKTVTMSAGLWLCGSFLLHAGFDLRDSKRAL